jgi:hypothetical protein
MAFACAVTFQHQWLLSVPKKHQWLLYSSDILTTAISSATPLVFLPSPSPPIPTVDIKSPGTCGCLLQTYFTISDRNGEGQAFYKVHMGGG